MGIKLISNLFSVERRNVGGINLLVDMRLCHGYTLFEVGHCHEFKAIGGSVGRVRWTADTPHSVD